MGSNTSPCATGRPDPVVVTGERAMVRAVRGGRPVFRDAQSLLFTRDGVATALVRSGEPRLTTFRAADAQPAPARRRVPLLRLARRLATS
jgi:hypothetical protein